MGRTVDLRLAGPVTLAWLVLACLVAAPRPVALTTGVAALSCGIALTCRRPGQTRSGRRPRPAATASLTRTAGLTLILVGLVSITCGWRGLAWENTQIGQLAQTGGRAEVIFRLSEPAKARASPWGGEDSIVAHGVVWLGPAAKGPGVPAVAYFDGLAPPAGTVMAFRGRLALLGRTEPERVAIQALEAPELSQPPGWRGAVYRLRAGLLQRASPLLCGITLGDTSALPPDLDAAMKVTSLTHITAVSGAHVAIVLGLVLGLAALVGAPRWVAALLGGLTLIAFLALIGPAPSVLRAVLMGGAAVLGLAAGKSRLALGALAGAVILVLLADPWLARSYGLVLSALSTAALIVVAPGLALWLRSRLPHLPRPVAEATALTCSAQLACAPVITAFAGQISLTALPANLLAAPAIPVATIAGLAGLGLVPVWPTGAGLAIAVGDAASGWVGWVGRWVASWPGAAIAWPNGAGGFALAVAATGGLIGLVWYARRWPVWARLWQRVVRHPGVTAGLATSLVAVIWASLSGPLSGVWRSALGGRPPTDWVAAVCDVGQGTAVALRTGPEAAVLVDAGPDGGGIDQCLDDLAIKRLDAVILTHFHADHVGGLAQAVAGRQWGELIHGTPCGELAQARRAWAIGDQAGALRRQIGLGPASGGDSRTTAPADEPVSAQIGQVRLTIYPSDLARFCPEQSSGGEEPAANNAGLTVWAQIGDDSIWALGDLEREGQDALLAHLESQVVNSPGGQLAADQTIAGTGGLVVVAHHGSANQSNSLAQALAPRLAVMSAGAGNPYGHPTSHTIDLYQRFGQIWRTDQDGRLVFQAGDFAN